MPRKEVLTRWQASGDEFVEFLRRQQCPLMAGIGGQSFIKLFAEAEEKFQAPKSDFVFCLAKEDEIEEFEKLFEKHNPKRDDEINAEREDDADVDEEVGKGFQLGKSDVQKMRAMATQVVVHQQGAWKSQQLLRSASSSKVDNGKSHRNDLKSIADESTDVVPILLPYNNWESEVHAAMELDSDSEVIDEQAKSKPVVNWQNEIWSTHSLNPNKIEPFPCLDDEEIDITTTEDPLDTVIDNSSSTVMPDSIASLDTSSVSDLLTVRTQSATEQRRSALFEMVRQAAEKNKNLRIVGVDASLLKQEEEKRRTDQKRKRIAKAQEDSNLNLVDASASIGKNETKRDRNAARLSQIGAKEDVMLNHHGLASQHRNTRAELSEHDLRYFHRPHLKERDFHCDIKLAKKSKSSSSSAATAVSNASLKPNPLSSSRHALDTSKLVNSERERHNLSLTSADTSFVVIEYVEESPPIVLNYGMSSAIVNYFRYNKDDNEGCIDEADEEELTPSASTQISNKKRKSTKLSLRAMQEIKKSIEDSNYRVPRHLMLLWELSNRKRPYDYDANIPRFGVGQTKVLDGPSPFLGEIENGSVQAAIVNRLFRAPLFPHRPANTDFLLICKKKDKADKKLSFMLRAIPHLFIAGQCEPLQIVPRPNYHTISEVEKNFFQLAIIRYLRSHSDGVTLPNLVRAILLYSGHCSISNDDRNKNNLPLHRNVQRKEFTKIANAVSEVEDIDGESRYFLRTDEPDEPELGVLKSKGGRGAHFESETLSEETLLARFEPEDVCLLQSSMAAEYRYLRNEIWDVEVWRIQRYLEHLLKLIEFRTKRRQSLLSNRYITDTGTKKSIEKLREVLDADIKRLQERQKVARFLLHHLARAPWNTTSTFVNSTIVKDDKGLMELNKYADPSGRSEGFAFFRTDSHAGQPRRNVRPQYFATDKDLRKLHGEEMVTLLKALGVLEKRARALPRWDKVHLIRSIITERYNNNTLPSALEKYVREIDTGKVSRQQYNRLCQNIWKRQRAALTLKDVPMVGNEETMPASTADENGEEAEDDGTREYQAFLRGEYLRNRSGAVETTSGPVTVESDTSPSAPNISPGLLCDKQSLPAGWKRPTHAVRQIVRKIDKEGRETVTISFRFDSESIMIARNNAQKAKRDRTERQLTKSFFVGGHDRSSGDRESRAAEDIDAASSSAKLTFSWTKMKNIATQSKHDKEDEYLAQAASSNRSRKSLPSATGADPDGDVARGGLNLKSTKRHGDLQINFRAPRISFAARLEKILMEVWKFPTAQEFRQPVPMQTPGYYAQIENPICLLDMRNKIANYQYDKAEALLADLNVMVSNCEFYNGANHPIAKNGRKVRDYVKSQLEHEKNTLGADRDTIAIMEDAIRKSKLVNNSR